MAKKKKKKFHGARHVKRDLRKEVMEVFFSNPNKFFNYKQIAGLLGVKDSSVRGLIHEIMKLEVDKERLEQPERGKFKLKAASLELVEGTIQITKNGRGFVLVDGMEEDIHIRRGETGGALWGDLVEVAFHPGAKKPEGKVVQVLERARDQYVGIIDISKNFAFCVPSNQRIHVDFFIPLGALNGAKHGDKVVVEIESWDDPDDSPVAKVVSILGLPGENDVEMHAILVEYGLPYEFPEEVEDAAAEIPVEITKKEIEKRRDMREICTFTIDPYDAKDFDDALSVEKLKNGHWEIGIHIADVSHYLKPDTILDKEAYHRATSVYLVDRTIPMLPEVLSNGLCSLRPDEEKLCFSAIFELNDKGKVLNRWFGRTVINSDRRFTYEEAQEVIESGKGDFKEEILLLNDLAKKLRVERQKIGGIDFNTEEVKFKLDEQGKPIGIYLKQMKDSNRLIEDFMLLANTEVARFIGERKPTPPTFVYRVHDNPDVEKLKQLREFVSRFDVNMPKINEENSATVLRDLMSKIDELPGGDIIKTMAIRTMAKAEYDIQNIGHYGLAFDFYTHFTSPIRRYPDVMVHRLLQHYLDGGSAVNPSDYAVKCRHSSAMEKRASEAERASIKYKQVEYMFAHIGETFAGVISGLTGWGIYVEIIETRCEGMVTLESMRDDRYAFDEKYYIIKGSRRGNEYHLGDEVQVKVIGANLNKRQLDFELTK